MFQHVKRDLKARIYFTKY